MNTVEHIAGETYHGRRGGIENAFRYSIDYVLLDAEERQAAPGLFGRNRANLMSLQDKDHGGALGAGQGAAWVRAVLQEHGLAQPQKIMLLAQPRMLGHVFNPVSFWLCYDAEAALRVVIAEVSNTFKQRHSYLCYHDDLRPITGAQTLSAQKIFHVSPFQPVAGAYTFRFNVSADTIKIVIDYNRGAGGLVATLTGKRKPLSNRAILRAAVRRPFGSRRVLALIHWQALKLWWKKATFRSCPPPLDTDVSR